MLGSVDWPGRKACDFPSPNRHFLGPLGQRGRCLQSLSMTGDSETERCHSVAGVPAWHREGSKFDPLNHITRCSDTCL